MKLKGNQLKQVVDALLSGYDSESDLEMMARMKLNQNLNVITGGQNLQEVVFGLVKWAESHGKLDELVSSAHEFNPGNQELQNLVNSYTSWKTADDDSSPSVLHPKTYTTVIVWGALIGGIIFVSYMFIPYFSDMLAFEKLMDEPSATAVSDDTLTQLGAVHTSAATSVDNNDVLISTPASTSMSVLVSTPTVDISSEDPQPTTRPCTILTEESDCRIEFGWTGGDANGDNPNVFTFVDVVDIDIQPGSGGAGLIIKYDWQNGILNGAVTMIDGRYFGMWLQDDSDGGEFELTFNPEWTEATGWWNYKGTPLEYRAVLRVNKRQ